MQPAHAWQFMYPLLACHTHGELAVGDGHRLYWEECGHPLGLPALFVHGGPGAGCTADDRRWFDPSRYRIVLFDQRGAGRSCPAGGLAGNDTPKLVGDMEKLRRHLGIERWLLFGGSWGSTLALAYAKRHPERVHALVLRGVFTAGSDEIRWLYGADGAAARLSAAWRRQSPLLGRSGDAGLLDGLAAALQGVEPEAQQTAARDWLQWEPDLMNAEMWPVAAAPGPASAAEQTPGCSVAAAAADCAPCSPSRATGDAAAALAMARIGVHFARHGFFLDRPLLANVAGLRRIPCVIVQGERDLVTPAGAALALHRAWPDSELHLVAMAGHSSRHPAIAQRLIKATDFFAAAPARAAERMAGIDITA